MNALHEIRTFRPLQIERLRAQLSMYKADRKRRLGSNSNEGIASDIFSSELALSFVSAEESGSKGFFTSIERFLKGTQIPGPTRLKAIAALLIEKRYLSIEELLADEIEDKIPELQHRFSSFLSDDFSELSQIPPLTKFEMRSECGSFAEEFEMTRIGPECGCCISISLQEFRRPIWNPIARKIASGVYVGWVSITESGGLVALAKRGADKKALVLSGSIAPNGVKFARMGSQHSLRVSRRQG